jgi:HEAT repeat protein
MLSSYILMIIYLSQGSLEMRPGLSKVLSTLERGSDREKMACLKRIWSEEHPSVQHTDIPLSALLRCLETATTELKDRLIIFIGNRDWKGSDAAQRFQHIAKNRKETDSVRQTAISFLADRSFDFLHCFAELLGDKSPKIRQTVASSLGQIDVGKVGEQGVKRLLLSVFQDKDGEVRLSGLGALRDLWEEKGTCLDFGEQKDLLVSVYVLAGAAHCKPANSQIHDSLLGLLSHKKAEVREIAAYGLESARKVSLPNLKRINTELMNESAAVRQSLCVVLYFLDPDKAKIVTNLGKCVRDKDPGVRSSAALAAGKLRIKQLIDDVIQALEDPEVSQHALNALGLMGDSSPKVINAILNAERRNLLEPEDVTAVLKQLGKPRRSH